ncbi:MAG: glycosyltransferase family 39 protein [Planctomycetota bacterium]
MRRSHGAVALALLGVTLAAHAATWLRPDWSGTEGQRVLVAHWMVGSGEYLVPQLGGETQLTKPPLFYWLLAACEHLFGIARPAARLPALLAIWWCACAAFGSLARLADRRSAWFAALGVILAPSVLWHGAFAEIDPVFMACTTVSVLWMCEGATTGSTARLIAAGLVGAAALLTKGPPYLMFATVPAILVGRGAWRRCALGFLPALLVPVGVFLAVFLPALQHAASATTGQAAQVAATETIGRIGSFDADSLLDLPLHLLRALAATLPFGPFAWQAWRCRDTTPLARLERAAVWAFVAAMLVLAVFPTRPPRYLLPGVPLLAIAAARRMSRWTSAAVDAPAWLRRTLVGLCVLAAAACATLPFLSAPVFVRSTIAATLFALACGTARTRLRALSCVALATVLVVSCVVPDRNAVRDRGLRDEETIAGILRDAMHQLGVERFEFWGNPGESFALVLDPDAHWRDRQSREVTTDWVVARWYDGQQPDLDPDRWVERLRVRGQARCFVLAQRR